MRRTFVIGDIHGCHRPLAELLAKIAPDPAEDAVVILGDFVNRGPGSRQTLDQLLDLRRRLRHFIALMGNHERMLLDYLAGRNRDLFLAVGGRQTLASYGLTPGAGPADFPQEHLAFFEDLLTAWEDDSHIYVHAGLEPGVHLTQQSEDWLLWAREEFIDSSHDFGKRVIFGHTPFALPLVEENKIGIDTGAVYGGRLTCLILPELEWVSVPGRRWWPPQEGGETG